MGKDDGDVAVVFGANHPIQLAEFTAEDVSVEEEQAVKGLVLGGSRHMLAHRQVGEEAAHLLGSKAGCRAAADKALKPGNPEAVGLQGPGGVVAEEDRRLEVTVFLLPGSATSWHPRPGGLGARRAGIGERRCGPVLALGACRLQRYLPCRGRRTALRGRPRGLGWNRCD